MTVSLQNSHHHHHQLNIHFLPRKSIKGIDGCFPATFWDFLFSHSDSSNSRKSRLVTILKAAVYPWESWSEFLVAGCPSSHQPTRIRVGKRRWNLEDLSCQSASIAVFLLVWYFFSFQVAWFWCILGKQQWASSRGGFWCHVSNHLICILVNTKLYKRDAVWRLRGAV